MVQQLCARCVCEHTHPPASTVRNVKNNDRFLFWLGLRAYPTGILSAASLTGGLLSGRCPPPGPAFMIVLLAAGVGGSGSGSGGGALGVGGGEWRATAALVTCVSCLLRVGLLLLENGASVGPFPEVSASCVLVSFLCVVLCAIRQPATITGGRRGREGGVLFNTLQSIVLMPMRKKRGAED